MSIIVKKFGFGILYSKALFVSENTSAYLAMERDGSITMRRNKSAETFFLSFADMKMPIRKIGMDKNGIIRVFSDLRIQYPLKIEYNTYTFNSREIKATLLDDCSFGVYDKSGNLVYRAEF
jgi:hypothetical protein